MCGNQTMDMPIPFYVYGQNNFQAKIYCSESLIWSINGSILINTDIQARGCDAVGYQTLIFTIPQSGVYNDQDFNNIQSAISTLTVISLERINVTQYPNSKKRQINEGQIVVQISSKDPGNANAIESSSAAYQINQLFANNSTQATKAIFNGVGNLSSSTVSAITVNALTYNETVGITKGCYLKDPTTGISTLFSTGTNIGCYTVNGTFVNNNNNDDSQAQKEIQQSTTITTIVIAIVIGVVAVVILMTVILMIIPGTRQAIFPSQKVRDNIKRKTTTYHDEKSSSK